MNKSYLETTWLYRDHRGGLTESMATIKSFDNLFLLLNYIRFKEQCSIYDISIFLYDSSLDKRIGWNYTYLLCVKNNAIGFCTDSYVNYCTK